jgi:hypothetical protein
MFSTLNLSELCGLFELAIFSLTIDEIFGIFFAVDLLKGISGLFSSIALVFLLFSLMSIISNLPSVRFSSSKSFFSFISSSL